MSFLFRFVSVHLKNCKLWLPIYFLLMASTCSLKKTEQKTKQNKKGGKKKKRKTSDDKVGKKEKKIENEKCAKK